MRIKGMQGLGDNIYQRAFLQKINETIFLDTPWPEIYEDLPHIKPVMPRTRLRTQIKNIKKNKTWYTSNKPAKPIRYSKGGIINGMASCLNSKEYEMNLPFFGYSIVEGDYIVIRPVTVRSEWQAESRNPIPEYIYKISLEAKKRGIKVVSVADLEDGKEWALNPLPVADVVFHKGELSVKQLLSLVHGSIGVAGGIGWIVPACIAYNKKSLIVCGGQGGFNAPELITDSAMDLSNIKFAVPDNFCRCTEKNHNCNKEIKNFDSILKEWIDGIRI